MVQILKNMTTNKTCRVSDVYGDQIEVDGQWFHAERIFGKPAMQFVVGQLVDELSQTSAPVQAFEPDELVACALYRGCSSNEMNESKIAAFAEIMLSTRGWGKFPMISGYIETLDTNDVEQCDRLIAEGDAHLWLSELGWSRMITSADLGTRYVHIDNGHHRMAAASIASKEIGLIFVPVADRKREEDMPQFMTMRP